MRFLATRLAASLLCVLLAVAAGQPAAAQGLRIIRDAEVESIIRDYTTPLLQVAGLSPSGTRVYLVQDRRFNAFATAGQRIFVNTGLLIESDKPSQVIGVLAHEIGHVAGGHLIGRQEQSEAAALKLLASQILGIGAAIATGRGEAAAAVIGGGTDLALKGLLSFSRSQEQAADQAAVRYLKGTKQSPRGMLEVTQFLRNQEALLATNQDPYLRTHPLTQDRVAFLERSLATSPYADAVDSPDVIARHQRMRAKLIGFLERPDQVLRTYPESDTSVPARYARAIAHFRRPDLDRALPLIDGLIAEQPKDPFFHELRGQMLFENGRVAEALPSYQVSVEAFPGAPQLRLALAQVQIELNQPAQDKAALDNLKQVLRKEPGNSFAWRLSAIAYGRQGDKGMTSLALAEGALARGQAGEARQQANRAKQILPENTPAWLRAQDVANLAERLAKRSN